MAGTAAEIKVSFVVPLHLYIVKSLLEFNEHIKGAESAN